MISNAKIKWGYIKLKIFCIPNKQANQNENPATEWKKCVQVIHLKNDYYFFIFWIFLTSNKNLIFINLLHINSSKDFLKTQRILYFVYITNFLGVVKNEKWEMGARLTASITYALQTSKSKVHDNKYCYCGREFRCLLVFGSLFLLSKHEDYTSLLPFHQERPCDWPTQGATAVILSFLSWSVCLLV